jgi:para-nitrobenzyl esterase
MLFPRARLAAALLVSIALCGCASTPGRVSYLIDSPRRRPLTVETTSGPVRGVATPLGQAFLAIPFAAPPIGPLRFQPPVPPTPWPEARDATKAGAICEQKAFPGSGRQSEDCLTVNVYAPADAAPGKALPVMVWIYGGSLISGDNIMYDPSRLAERRGVIVVSPNYRLGALGFLAHPALRGAGEGAYALIDQQAALRWTRDNIARFGGDPGNVTLFGESAGAWSVCYQLVAPGGRGLFQHAIIESGSCTSPDSAVSMAAAEAGGALMAAELGCGDGAGAADCLRRLPAKALVNAKSRRRGLDGVNAWAPAFGGDVLPQSPKAALENGAFEAMPVIDGTNRDEGRLFLDINRVQGKLWTERSYEKILTDAFEDKTPLVLAEYADEARRTLGLAYADVVTDSTFACPALTLNALLERRTRVWAYEFNDPHAAVGWPRLPFTPPLKAYHSSELAYVFQTRWLAADPASFDPAQRALSDRMQAYWSAFARSGDPAAGAGRDAWPADNDSGPLELTPSGDHISPNFAKTHHCEFWNKLGY